MVIVEFLQSRIPDLSNIAIEEDGNKITYRELINSIENVSNWMNDNLEDNQGIAVYLPRSIEQIVVMLAIFESGKTYVPIDLDVAPDRISYIINSASCKYIISQKNIISNVSGSIFSNMTLCEFDTISKPSLNVAREKNILHLQICLMRI